MNMDYEEIPLLIKADYFVKNTPKAYCFKLWGKKFIAFPISICKGFYTPEQMESDFYRIIMPKWYVAQHTLASLMEDKEQKERIFPPKRKKQAETPLFNQSLKTEGDLNNSEVSCETVHRPDWW